MSHRPLAGIAVGFSAGGSDADLARKGFTQAGLNRLTVRFAEGLLASGARLVFGHDWREKGVMRAIAAAAIDYRWDESEVPAIHSLLAWPSSTSVKPEVRSELAGVLLVESAGLPEDATGLAAELDRQAHSEPQRERLEAYLRARGLTWLRRRLTSECQARILIGGKTRDFSGRYPGLVEEAGFALEAKRPIYLLGLLGGVAEILGRAASEREFEVPKDFGAATILKDLVAFYAKSSPRPLISSDDTLDFPTFWAELVDQTRQALFISVPPTNGLSPEENECLLTTTLEEEALYLVLKGLERVFRETSSSA